MESYQPRVSELCPELWSALESYRKARRFTAPGFARASAVLLNEYLRDCGLRSVVLGVSGGVDSAVTLGIATLARSMSGSPLVDLLPVSLPVSVQEGATTQLEAAQLAEIVAAHFGVDLLSIELGEIQQLTRLTVDRSLGTHSESWASGQLVSLIRLPVLYYVSNLLAAQSGSPGLILGTVNRDEGGFAGFFGKRSDLLDYQPISGLHKSEVYQLADWLRVPEIVTQTPPRGDVFDGLTDREMFQAPYDFIELYSWYLNLSGAEQQDFFESLGEEAKAQFFGWQKPLEERYLRNRHKYFCGAASVHRDVYPRAVAGGWRDSIAKLEQLRPEESNFVGEFELSAEDLSSLIDLESGEDTSRAIRTSPETLTHPQILCLDQVLSDGEVDRFMDYVVKQRFERADTHGRNPRPSTECAGGSLRASCFSPELAEVLWKRIAPHLDPVYTFAPGETSDPHSRRVFRPVGLNALGRWILYDWQSHLVPHRDSSFEFADGVHVTLMSVLVYFSDADDYSGGATRFILDPDRYLLGEERSFKDWERSATASEVLKEIVPRKGRVLIFPHHLLHDAEKWLGGGVKLVLRTDVVFRVCGDLPIPLVPQPDRVFQGALTTPSGNELCQSDVELQKISQDPFYSHLLEDEGKDAVFEAGYFEDKESPESRALRINRPYLGLTPTDKIEFQLDLLKSTADEEKGEPRFAVVLLTGGLCPPHEGHLNALIQARKELQEQGYYVLGGYLSPDHQDYLLEKLSFEETAEPAEVPSLDQRLSWCKELVKDSEWIMVDAFNALGTSTPLNFTEIVEHLSRLLNRRIRTHRPLEVFYVAGGDNARFASAFKRRGGFVCIQRPGFSDEFKRISEDWSLKTNERTYLLEPATVLERSSSEIRVTKSCGFNVKEEADSPDLFVVRDDLWWSVQPWVSTASVEVHERVQEYCGSFVTTLVSELAKSGAGSAEGEAPVAVVTVAEQQKVMKRLRAELPVISLDPCVEGDYQLKVSRRFLRQTAHSEWLKGARPGSGFLSAQISLIPEGRYILVDDDRMTGSTEQFARSLLARNPNIVIERFETLHSELPDSQGEKEICDSRDFLLGAREAGLVVLDVKRRSSRVPYLFPHTDLSSRLSLSEEASRRFSHVLWAANLLFFESLQSCGIQPRVADADLASRKFLNWLGFCDDILLCEVVRQHVDGLRA